MRSNPVLFFGIKFLIVIKFLGNFVLRVFRCFEFGAPEDHPDLGESLLTGNPGSDFNKWELFDSVHGNPYVEEFYAVYHYDKTDKGVKPKIFGEGRRIIKRR